MSQSRFVYAVFNFPGTTEEDLPLVAGERIEVISRDDEFGDGWWEGVNERGQQGLFPKIYTAETYPVSASAAASQSSLSESLARVDEEPESEASMDRLEERERAAFVQNADTNQMATTTTTSSSSSKEFNSIAAVQAWSPAQVAEHFAKLGLGDVAPKFAEHEVSGRILLEMQHTDLREIDINAFGKRFEIMKEIDALRRVDTTDDTLQQLRQDSGPSTPPLDFSSRSSARKSRILPQQSVTGALLADSNESSEDHAENPATHKSISSPQKDSGLAPALGRDTINHNRTDSGVGSSVNSTTAGDSATKNSTAPATPNPSGKTHRKSLSTSSLALDTTKVDPVTGRRSPDKRHSRTWSQDTVKINTHKRGTSSGLGPVGEEIAASIASSDSIPRSPSSPASATLTSPSSAKPSLISKKSLLGRRQKWRPNAVSENLENIPAAEAAKDADLSGWLRKRGEKTYNWKVRYFVLKGTRLAYYLSDHDTQEKGLIDVNSHRVAMVDDILFYGPNRNTFKITPPAPGASRSLNFTPPKTHYFCAESKEQCRQWIAALTKATIGRDWSTPVISSCTTKTISLKAAREQRGQKLANATAALNGQTLEPGIDLEQDQLPEPSVLNPDQISSPHQPQSADFATTRNDDDDDNHDDAEHQSDATSLRKAVLGATGQ